jgi:hypothetical protein
MTIRLRDTIRSDSRVDIGFLALLAALVILPLYPKIGLVSVSGTYIPVRIDDIVTLVVVAAWGWTLVRERRLPRVPPIAPFALAWLVAGLIALGIGAGLLDTIGWGTGALFWAKPIEYLLLGWAAFDLVNRPDRLRLVLVAVFAAAAVVLAYALLERFGWVAPAPNYATDVTARRGVLGSTMGDQHQMATYLGIVVLVGISIWNLVDRRLQLVGLVGIVVAAYVLGHAAGRSEYFSLMVCALPLALRRSTRVPAAVLVLSLVTVFFLPPVVERTLETALLRPDRPATGQPTPRPAPGSSLQPGASPGSTLPPIDVSDRVGDLEADRSLEIRLRERWPMFFRIAMRDPLFGAGPSAATEAADGYYVRSFTEVGLVGTVAFLALVGSIVFGLWRVFRRGGPFAGSVALGLIGATAFVALVGLLIDTWVASRVMQLYWPLVGAALASGGAIVLGARPASDA